MTEQLQLPHSATAVLGTALVLAATAIYCRHAGGRNGGAIEGRAVAGQTRPEGACEVRRVPTAGHGPKRKTKKQKPMKKGFFGQAASPPKSGRNPTAKEQPENQELLAAPSISANEVAAHQLMLRGSKQSPRSAAEEQLTKTWKKAYWDRFAELMAERPPDLSQLVQTLRDLRSRIIGLTPSRDDLRDEIIARIDLDLIEQMIDNEALAVSDLRELVQFMVGRLRKLEAPAENAATDAWLTQMASELGTLPTAEQWSALVPRAFVYISDKIDTIARDSAKSKQEFLAGYLSSHGADYERDNFAARGQVANVKAFATGWAEAQRKEGKQELSVADLVHEMLVGLVTSPTALPKVADKLPETLALDIRQLHATQNEVQAIVLCCGWLHACTSVASLAAAATAGAQKKGLEPQQLAALKATVLTELQNERPPTTEEAERFKSPLDKIIATIEAQLKAALVEQGLEYGAKQQKVFRTLVTNMPDESNKVFALMKSRVTQALRKALAASEEDDAAAVGAHLAVNVAPGNMASGGTLMVAASGPQKQAPVDVVKKPDGDGLAGAKLWMTKNNLSTVCTEVMRVAETLRPVMRHQIRVHGGLYTALLAPP